MNVMRSLTPNRKYGNEVNKFKIKHGSTRTTILIGKFAIKIPSFVGKEFRLFLLGLVGNIDEHWRSHCHFNNAVNPVIFHIPGGWLNVYRRAEPLTEIQWISFDYHYHCNYTCRLVDRFVHMNFIENKYDSFGIVDDKIVAVDYA